ncbi:unnamed protein product [Penicillium salamii]|uniref:Zn(2)-C6 fungal-type domain-containing protein n=1 Tax=Penicillium salamii TaxID=1612424 RepID=A0A9W4IV13_9EURO|nr:unnamed protein product [Penicillium salamii]CAG8041629.1 unnamed protein product [Penicillium salamii]CAG8341619.1 unnamed protein product [Penicillium salamii]CAG8343059.1 unnamed protein product [Penicillium salamii]CAG8343244.1 unnamed protein product [Penicillium salamii]
MSGITRGHSCILCQRRKVRCDKQKPCGNCVKAKAECTVIPQRARGKRSAPRPESDLMGRLKKYEELLSRHGIDFNSNLDSRRDTEKPETSVAGNSPSIPSAPSQYSPRTNDQRSSKWFAFYNDYRTTNEMLHGGSNDSDQPTVHRAFDAMIDETGSFPFAAGPSRASTRSSQPSSMQSIQLWQIYINNVNPLLKISHIPTLQSHVIEASADLSEAPKPLRALMFGIYLTAVNSMTDDEVQAKFAETKANVMAMTRENTEHALLTASFMKSDDIMVLQAFFLYLIGLRLYVDPRSLFCYIGIAVRIATRLGLHRDGAQFGLSPFETEQRRRLWWQIVTLDKRIADITGSPTSALSSMGTDCRFPLNVNDIDLHPHAKEPPSPSTGVTGMTFFLSRIEIMIASAPDGIRPNPKVPANFRVHDGSIPISKRSNRDQSDHLDRYCTYMESAYLKQCNLNIPIQNFTFLMTRVSLCKLRVLDFICGDVSSREGDDKRREATFSAAIDLLEADNRIHLTEDLHGFIWYSHMQMPLPGYIFLANELSHHTKGDLCQRAWRALLQSPYHQGLSQNLRSPLHVGLGQAILKAWDARQTSEMQLGRSLQEHELVAALRASLTTHLSRPESTRPIAEDTERRDIPPSSFGPCQMSDTADLLLDPTSMYNPMSRMNDMLPSIELDYNEMAWTNLMQSGAIGGFWGNLDSLGQ